MRPPKNATLTIGLAVFALLQAAPLFAAPSLWERTARPRAAAEERTRREVEHLLFEAELFGLHSTIAQDRLSLACALLVEAGAEKAEDLRLRFHFGRVLAWLGDNERAVLVLEPLVREAPSHPMASEARFRLAIAYLWLGRRDDEIAMYDAFLDRVSSKPARATALSNRAEARMAQGDLRAAIDDYRASLAIDLDPATLYGLAVALDRSGDLTEALAEAGRAIVLDPDDERLHADGVFFLPAYERHWYEAVDLMARARRAENPADAARFWEAASTRFTLYMKEAGDADRWFALARARRESCEAELRKRGTAAPRRQRGAKR